MRKDESYMYWDRTPRTKFPSKLTDLFGVPIAKQRVEGGGLSFLGNYVLGELLFVLDLVDGLLAKRYWKI